MNNSCDLLITDASVVVPKVGVIETSIMVENGRINALASMSCPAQ
jgi:dihydropyrimidinase